MQYTDEELAKIIEDYFSMSSYPHALLLTGAWGAGKTYFIKKYFLNRNTEIECEVEGGTQKVKKKIVYISLYGIESLNALKNQLYDSMLNEKLGNGKLAMIASGAGYVLGTALSFAGINEGKENIEDIENKIKKTTIQPQDFLFIIDDIERTAIKVEDWMGVVSKLLETYETKVLLIGNENEILNGRERYKKEKEKIIGRTVLYQPSLHEKLDSLLQVPLYEPLKKYEDQIEEIMNQWGCENLRYIEFAGTILHSIEENVKNIVHPSLQNVDEIKNTIVKNALVVAIAYQTGMPKRPQDSDPNEYFVSQNYYAEAEYTKMSLISFKFIENYIYDFYFDKDFVRKSLKFFDDYLEDLSKNKKRNEEKINDPLNQLFDFEKLDDKKVESLINRVLQNLKGAKYGLHDYRNIFFIFSDLYKIGFLNANIDEITDTMKNNIFEKRYEKSIVNVGLYYADNVADEINHKWIELANLIDNEKKVERSDIDINPLLEKDNSVKKIINVLKQKQSQGVNELFYNVDIDLISDYIIKLENNDICELDKAMRILYGANNVKDFYQSDAEHILQLKDQLKTRLDNMNDGNFKIKKYNLNNLCKTLTKVYNKLK